MPESPEVDALAGFLDHRLAGRRVRDVDLVEFRALKTRGRPLTGLAGSRISRVERIGKHVDLRFDDQHLLLSLGRHGWVRWHEGPAPERADPPALAVLTFDDGGTMEATDAGGWVSVGLSVVDAPADVPAVAKLGPDPADARFSRADFDRVVAGRRKQVKAILQEQESMSGIGNAYSDEILHAAKVSPVAHGSTLDGASMDRLFDSTIEVTRDAIAARRGIPIDRLKEMKVAAMRVHGRAGQPCPVCADTIRDFAFASTEAQYCPTCQTAGVLL